MKIGPEFFGRSVHEVAPELVGCTLLVDGVGGTIVEVEAYAEDDPASHGFRGQTPRNAAMFGPPGRAYVYRSYGIHWCLNFVCGREGKAEAVLVRALEPTEGFDQMRERRGVWEARLLASGPGQALPGARASAPSTTGAGSTARRSRSPATATPRWSRACASGSRRRLSCPGATGSPARSS